jgi:hypothetical protein
MATGDNAVLTRGSVSFHTNGEDKDDDTRAPPGAPPWPRRGYRRAPVAHCRYFVLPPRNHFLALRDFGGAEHARSSTLMRESESKNAFSAVAKPTA